jgi:hypothetical protein
MMRPEEVIRMLAVVGFKRFQVLVIKKNALLNWKTLRETSKVG